MRPTTLVLLLLTAPALVASAPDADAAQRDFRGGKLLAESKNTSELRKRLKSSFTLPPDGDPNTADVAIVVSEFTDFSGPAPLDNPVTSQLVWEDDVTGEQIFSSVVDFEAEPLGETYTVVTTWFDADGNVLGSAEEALVAEARGPAPVSLEVLNPPNDQGDVVLTKGDLVQVSFSVLCDFPWLAEDCAAQKAESSRKDQIRLMTSGGEIVDKTKRGSKLEGLTLLKAKTLAADPLVVGYLRKDSSTIIATSETPITVVADPATATLIAQVAALEARVAELEAGQSAQDEAITFNRGRDDEFEDRVVAVSDTQILLDGRIQTNTDGIAGNSAAIEPLIQHLTLYADDKISFESSIATNAGGIASNAAALEDHKQLTEDVWLTFESSVATNTAGIATNAAGIADARPWWQQLQSAKPLAETEARVAANSGAIATNGANIQANKDKQKTDAFTFESSIEELDVYIAGQGKLIADNTSGVVANAADLGKHEQLTEGIWTSYENRIKATEGAVQVNADAIKGLGSPQANYVGILTSASVQLVGGEAAQVATMTFPHEGLTLTGLPVGDFFSVSDDGRVIDTGYRHFTDVEITDLTGDAPDSPVEVSLTLTGNQPGIKFDAGSSVTFPNVTSAPAGTPVDLFSVDGVTGELLHVGLGNITDDGAVFVTLTGQIEALY